jgi:hypothetical protein
VIRRIGSSALRTGLIVSAVGVAAVLVGLVVQDLLRVGWVTLLIGACVFAAGLLARNVLASPRRGLAALVAATAIAVLGLAAVEMTRHIDDDVSALVGKLPDGTESEVREGWAWFEKQIWARLWPW